MKKKLISLNFVNHNHLKMKMETDINLTFFSATIWHYIFSWRLTAHSFFKKHYK